MLPERFKERMREMLGDEAEQLFAAIEGQEAVKAFRVNTIKISLEDFEASDPDIERSKNSFPGDSYRTEEKHPGSLACHHSGAIYMQDISAMSTVHAVKLKKGMRVLDSCSAPGGKTTQLSQAVGERGIVLANEYDSKRCRILQGNVERMGCKNVVVTNLDTRQLALSYSGNFDLVLCDAPCSGEGMFRKNALAVSEWSEENVAMCAERQREILTNVAQCVATGGILLYSTCTFSLEENEKNVDWFLSCHKDFELCDAENDLVAVSSDGINFDGCRYDMSKTRRIYPHKSLGEGQFIAVMKRRADADLRGNDTDVPQKAQKERKQKNDITRKNAREQENLNIARKFLQDHLVNCPDDKLICLGDKIWLCPDIDLPEHSVYAAGVCVGEVQKGRLVPHHQLFSAYGKDFKLQIRLSSHSPLAYSYLRGMEIDCSDHVVCRGNESGFAALLIDECSAGGCKVSGNTAKNHYPKGLRIQ